MQQHDMIRLARNQVRADLQALPATLRARFSSDSAARRAIAIADLRLVARQKLPRPVFDFVDGAAGDELTANYNQADLRAVRLMPKVLTGAGPADLTTRVLGQHLDVPLIGAPTGMTAMIHPDAEVALARALTAGGAGYTLSTGASRPMAEVADARSRGPLFFQLYLGKDRHLAKALLDQASALGFGALMITVDTPTTGNRERDLRHKFATQRITARTLFSGAARPRWSARFLANPDVLSTRVLTEAAGGGASPAETARLIQEQFTPLLDWDDVAWVRDNWSGPMAIKGILRADDALRATDAGLDGVIVSNHGGRQLDHASSAVSALPAIVDAVGDRVDVLLDGGIRRGIDVLTALALGAKACLVGRPFIFGLGAGGRGGVTRALEILTTELHQAVTLAGAPSVRDLDRSWLATDGPTPFRITGTSR
ncbi:probable L-lactate dehydrogenase (cytochrome) (plasmid) [Rhodococcus jostii RHA1]|jgi:isopentenyl diphosphate isomerase/L-lactate dehydrogenase-like FMN-dependent dehydrogenase|uniref:Probable L-lactate dehydrogenase (Cytochrome) n=1 Tax=Rhodococcus jostii (strain RHA1) TaxID=101510 RepID=Q0RW64_RHOJR|nr:alpha-hydroxy acid oxidase [Rhodococcus jostii]ABH00472.1 probable L-lactate dehydrogenase (cytochrome) [Rhodococcus jostii RHA1]